MPKINFTKKLLTGFLNNGTTLYVIADEWLSNTHFAVHESLVTGGIDGVVEKAEGWTSVRIVRVGPDHLDALFPPDEVYERWAKVKIVTEEKFPTGRGKKKVPKPFDFLVLKPARPRARKKTAFAKFYLDRLNWPVGQFYSGGVYSPVRDALHRDNARRVLMPARIAAVR